MARLKLVFGWPRAGSPLGWAEVTEAAQAAGEAGEAGDE